MRYFSIIAGCLLLTVISCQKEDKLFATESARMSGIAVRTENELATRSQSHGNTTLFENMPYVTESGDTLYLSASVSDMVETVVEQTKCSPIASAEAIPEKKFYSYVYDDAGQYESVHNTSTGDDIVMAEVPIVYQSSKWSFGNDKTYYWPTDETEVLHFVSMGPANLIDGSYVSNLSGTGYGWQTSDKSLKGHFQSRKDDNVTDNDAINMYDFIYGYDDQSKQTHASSVSIALKHACVGVRFIIGDIFGTIGSISLKNFYREADFNIASSSLTWSNWSNKSEFRQVFNKKVDNSNKDSGNPLDDTTGETKTFMVIPQELRADAEMIIDMQNTLHPENLSFSKIREANPNLSLDWSEYQGKIITFKVSSVKANQVSVFFDDKVTGNVKSDLKFTNDGKSAIYIRACLVGNWLNKDGKVLTSWTENVTDPTKLHGTFTSTNSYFPDNVPTTAAAATAAGINWVKGADGFYYYKKILESGHTASQPLFDTFTVTSKPADSEGNWNTTGSSDESMQIVNFEMAILVQAVSAQVSSTAELTKEYAKTAWGSAVDAYLTTDYE